VSNVCPADYQFLQSLLYKQAGLVLDSAKEYLVEARLGPLAKKLNLEGIDALVQAVRARSAPDLEQRIVEAMTIHETVFFRDWKPFESLRLKVLPELLKARESTRRLNFWSAASSTGQEAYSIAMQLREHFPQLATWTVSIIGTDISSSVVAQARTGAYSQLEVNRGMPARLLTKYMRSEGANWVVRDEIRKMVEFRQMNLTKPWPLLPRMDVVFLRNVLIYFDGPTKRTIFSHVKEVSAPDSYLFLGAAESTLGLTDEFVKDTAEGASWYRQKNRGEVTL
jgi:chemotaxis protein methyltransferase CheR